ncbi:MAG: TonB-dependent receptor [Deltaproteobacteria bacterium]|nr:TonB-dependent receptor [Deltaproteobacteria bacterium]
MKVILRLKPPIFLWYLRTIALFLISFSSPLHAHDAVCEGEEAAAMPRFELDEIVVTASRIEEPIRTIPRNVTVITSGDIEQAPGNSIVDLIARESGLHLRSFFGNDKQAVIDIRGMGDTAPSNVVVMVDGVRLNSPDLTGPDFSSIHLDQVERIEIVRGAGSVIYGDGAVGGVINIITKEGRKEPEVCLYTSYGSYATFDGRACYRGSSNNLNLAAMGDYYDSDGYRENGYFQKKDASVKTGYDPSDYVSFRLAGSLHQDECGLPGPVSKENKDIMEKRTTTDRPHDYGETTDWRVVGDVEIWLGKWGMLSAKRGYRIRDNSYIIGYSPLISETDQTDTIDEDTKSLILGYNKDYDAFGLHHGLQCGIDYYVTEYVREERSRDQRKNSETKPIGGYLSNDWHLTKDLLLQWGYRYNEYKGRFREDLRKSFNGIKRWVNGDITEKKLTHNVYDAGLVYAYRPEATFFSGYATSFRIPNVDEFARADEYLKPQQGRHLEIGGRIHLGDTMEWAVTLFRAEIEDEIYFGEDPLTGESFNRNYDEKTMRRGVETDVRIYPTDSMYLWGNYTYTEAKFEDKATFVPLVPRHKASVGVEWNILKPLVLSLTGTFVGSRFDGNDENNNRYEKLDCYTVLDGKLTFTHRGFTLFIGVNNILDELYSTTAYSESYYPMPTRNAYGGLEWRF